MNFDAAPEQVQVKRRQTSSSSSGRGRHSLHCRLHYSKVPI